MLSRSSVYYFLFLNMFSLFLPSLSFALECEEKIKYKFDLDDALDENEGVKVSEVYQEEVQVINDKIAANYKRLDRVGDLFKDGVYFPKDQNFSMVVPKLTKGVVSIYQKNAPLEQGEPSTFTAKFGDSSYKIAAVNTIELDWIPKGTDMLAQFRKQQVHLVKSLDPSTYQFCEMDGKYGLGLEMIVFNQVPNFEWPHRYVKRDEKSKSIGIRREFHMEQSVVEFSLVIPADSEDDKEDMIEDAREAMDLFMSGYKILEKK